MPSLNRSRPDIKYERLGAVLRLNKYMGRYKKTIVSIVGARPQFVKLACLASKLSQLSRHIIVHTGQHYDPQMSGVFFKQLEIPKIDHNLKVGSGCHGEMTGNIIIKLEKLFLKLKPDTVLVYGDTNSTLAGAITASKMGVPLGHIEAGLRSFDDSMPEEINRRITDHVSSLLFAPTKTAIRNLKKEGLVNGVVHSGDLMYELIDNYQGFIDGNGSLLDSLGLVPKEYYLMTIHRAGNVDYEDKLLKIVKIIERLNAPVYFPIHPRTLNSLKKYKLLKRLRSASHCIIAQPLSYLDNLTIISGARAVLTDSGGVQKESIFLKTPCLTMRDETEWTETLKWGNHLVGLSERKIMALVRSKNIRVRPVEYKIDGRQPSDIIIDGALKLV